MAHPWQINPTPEFRRLMRRYNAGLRAVKCGADPYQTLYFVLFPSEKIEDVQDAWDERLERIR